MTALGFMHRKMCSAYQPTDATLRGSKKHGASHFFSVKHLQINRNNSPAQLGKALENYLAIPV
jgi:hypothetical protein